MEEEQAKLVLLPEIVPVKVCSHVFLIYVSSVSIFATQKRIASSPRSIHELALRDILRRWTWSLLLPVAAWTSWPIRLQVGGEDFTGVTLAYPKRWNGWNSPPNSHIQWIRQLGVNVRRNRTIEARCFKEEECLERLNAGNLGTL